jgi:hypothetical protein
MDLAIHAERRTLSTRLLRKMPIVAENQEFKDSGCGSVLSASRSIL